MATATREALLVRRVPTACVELKPVVTEGAERCSIREILTSREGAPTFAMRQFVVEPGGHTPLHQHPWEHEVYILGGNGRLQLADGQEALAAGDAVLVAPNELHRFECVGDQPLVFLCMIPVEEVCCR